MDYFDQFPIFFWEDKLFTGRRWYPLREITTELLNLDSKWFEKLQSAADNFVPTGREMLAGKNEKAFHPPVQQEYQNHPKTY